jgi:hypothetical protein
MSASPARLVAARALGGGHLGAIVVAEGVGVAVRLAVLRGAGGERGGERHWELTTLVTKVVTTSINNLQGVLTRGVVTKGVVTIKVVMGVVAL